MDTTYNGWKNYETWNVALWLGNDEGLYRAAREARVRSGADAERFVRAVMPNGTPDFNGDCARYRRVHWPSIARAMRER